MLPCSHDCYSGRDLFGLGIPSVRARLNSVPEAFLTDACLSDPVTVTCTETETLSCTSDNYSVYGIAHQARSLITCADSCVALPKPFSKLRCCLEAFQLTFFKLDHIRGNYGEHIQFYLWFSIDVLFCRSTRLPLTLQRSSSTQRNSLLQRPRQLMRR